MKLRFKIKHLMYLTLWTALLLSLREPIAASVPLLLEALIWASVVGGVALIAGLYGVALFMREGHQKDRVLTLLFNVLIGDAILMLVSTLTEVRIQQG